MISSQQLGERLADARKRAGLTQAQVSERLGVARTTLVAMEKGERRPSNAELVRLAEIVQAKLHDLLREGVVRAEVSPRFRMSSGEREASSVQNAVERLRVLGARYVELERLHKIHRAPAPLETIQTYRVDPREPSALDPRMEGEDAARTVRAMLGLGDEPATHLDERFESEAGLRIFYLDRLPSKLCAFLIWSDELGACVAINRAHPRVRQRWSLTHELGHFLRDREAGDVLDEGDASPRAGELFPDAFTNEFLLPAAGVRKRFAERYRTGKFTPVDLHALARIFGVAFQTMAQRLEELRLLPRGTYEKILQSRLHPQDLGPREPLPKRSLIELGLPERYVALAVSAYYAEQLSENEFAEMLATDIPTARAVFQKHQRVIVDGMQLRAEVANVNLRMA